MTSGRLPALSDAMGEAEFVQAMESYAAAFPTYRERLPRIPFSYTRTRLLVTPVYEVVVMQWAGGSLSPIHDHGNSRCWVLMLDGTLDIENFTRENDPQDDRVEMRPAGKRTLKPEDIDYRNGPAEMHRVRNPSNECAYSLQLYSEPITQYVVVDTHDNTQRLVTACCDLELTL